MNSKSAVIVEEDRIVALYLQSELISLGYRIVGNLSVVYDAFRCAEKNNADVVIMAISNNDGYRVLDVAGRIKNKLEIPVVFLSTLTDLILIQRAREIAPGRILNKPFSDNALHLILECIFKHKEKAVATEAVEVPLNYAKGNRYGRADLLMLDQSNMRLDF